MGITGIILAGGQGSRMGGVNKAMLSLHGKPLITHALQRFAPQVDELFINANTDIEQFNQLGYPVISDTASGFPGPLAGLQAGMEKSSQALIATIPCDSPFLPCDLVRRLEEALHAKHADVAVAHANQRLQPVFCLCRCALLPKLTQYLQQGGRKMETWFDSLRYAPVEFDDAAAFTNINTPEELATLEIIS